MTRSILVLGLLTAVAASAQDWTMGSRDREHTSWAREETALRPPFQARNIRVAIAQGIEDISFFDSTMYLTAGGSANELAAADPATGAVLWSMILPGTNGSIGNAAAVTGDVVICGGQQTDTVYGVSRNSGLVRWQRVVGRMYSHDVTVDADRVYVRADSLYCLAVTDGALVWKAAPGPNGGGGSPTLDDARVYVTGRDSLYAFDKATGERRWTSGRAEPYGLAVDAKGVYFSGFGSVRCVDPATGMERWNTPIADGKSVAYILGNGLAIDDAHVAYVVFENKDSLGTISMLDAGTGAELWSHVLPARGAFSPTFANGIVYVVNWMSGALWGFDAASGTVLLRDSSNYYKEQPIVRRGRMYVASGAGVVELSMPTSGVRGAGTRTSLSIEAYPNPASAGTQFVFDLPRAAHTRIDIVDVLGRRVATVADGWCDAGTHRVSWTPANLPAGFYIARIAAAGEAATRVLAIP